MATTAGFLSLGQDGKSAIDTVDVKSAELLQNREEQLHFDDKYIDTWYEYVDSAGGKFIIQNSLPKGGLRYRNAKGEDFVYTVFWTNISNETANSVELAIDFPADSLELPSSVGVFFKLFLPSEVMTPDKESLFNYGLVELRSYLDNDLQKSSSLQKTISPNGSYTFYVVTLFNQGVDGVVRAGLSLKEQSLFYRVNDKEVACGFVKF